MQKSIAATFVLKNTGLGDANYCLNTRYKDQKGVNIEICFFMSKCCFTQHFCLREIFEWHMKELRTLLIIFIFLYHANVIYSTLSLVPSCALPSSLKMPTIYLLSLTNGYFYILTYFDILSNTRKNVLFSTALLFWFYAYYEFEKLTHKSPWRVVFRTS